MSRFFPSLILILLVVLTSWYMRTANDMRIMNSDSENDWYSIDSDGLYHMKRLESFRDTKNVLPAAIDPYLNFPKGAIIPWPPYYTIVLDLLCGGSVEQDAATVPLFFGVLTSLVVALSGWLLAGPSAAIAGGLLHAFSYGSIHYSSFGVADHHAFISFLLSVLLFLFTCLLKFRHSLSVGRAFSLAVFSGAIVGLMLGSWVGSFLYVVPLQLLSIWLMYKYNQKPLVLFVSALHFFAALVVSPAVFQSPWIASHPFMVINLSWFHLLWLALGFLLPLFLLFSFGADNQKKIIRNMFFGLLGVGATLFVFDMPPVPGIKEGFSWIGRIDPFMASIAESLPLIGDGALKHGGWILWLGPISLVTFIPLFFGRARIFLKSNIAVLPWLVSFFPLLFQSLSQRRFSDAFAVPLAVIASLILVGIFCYFSISKLFKYCVLLSTIFIFNIPSILHVHAKPFGEESSIVKLAERKLFSWIASEPPAARSVLAAWDFGHMVEWVAKRPSIATNFGSYIGVDSFVDPAKFFMTSDVTVAENILQNRGVQYIVVTSRLPQLLNSHAERANLPVKNYRRLAGDSAELLPLWFHTMGAQLFNLGYVPSGGEIQSLDFLRLVHISSTIVEVAPQLGSKTAAGRVWEYVPGAQVVFSGIPGEEVLVEVDVSFNILASSPFRFLWRRHEKCNQEGIAVIRVPYARGTNGDAYVSSIRLASSSTTKELYLTQNQVQAGETVNVK